MDRIQVDLPHDDHVFYVLRRDSAEFSAKMGPNVQELPIARRLGPLRLMSDRALMSDLWRARVVVVHGLFAETLARFLLAQPWVLSKSVWIVWGGDLYSYSLRPASNRAESVAAWERKVIGRRCREVVTLTDGDAEAFGRFAGITPPARRVRYYNPLESEVLEILAGPVRERTEVTRVLVGTSANASNRHLDILRTLSKFSEESIEVVVPLGYGKSDAYLREVLAAGDELFGAKFRPMLDFEDPARFAHTLDEMDVAVFDHNRQQGLGSITALCGLGKKVYSNPDNSSWRHLGQWATIFDVRGIADESFDQFRTFSSVAAEQQRQIYRSDELRAHRVRLWLALLNQSRY